MHIETSSTVLVQIEGILNRRPLTALSASPDDCEPLNPAHILYPAFASHQSVIPPSHKDADAAAGFRGKFQQALARVNQFWRVWERDYRSMMHQMAKCASSRDDIAVGDLVLLVDNQQQRAQWRMVKVVEATPTDNHVRKVTVRTADGKFHLKDRTRVVRLELDVDEFVNKDV